MVHERRPAPARVDDGRALTAGRYRFIILLGGLLLVLLAAPLAVADRVLDPRFARILIETTFVLMLLSAVFAVSTKRRETITASAERGR